MNTTNNVHIFLAIVLSVQIANCCDLCFKFSGHTGIAYCTHSTRCVKVLNGYADKRLREVRVRNCNVTVVLSPDLLNIDIKDRTGKRCYGKYFFLECMNNVQSPYAVIQLSVGEKRRVAREYISVYATNLLFRFLLNVE